MTDAAPAEQWSAVAEAGTIAAGTRVEVVAVHGVRLTVREIAQ